MFRVRRREAERERERASERDTQRETERVRERGCYERAVYKPTKEGCGPSEPTATLEAACTAAVPMNLQDMLSLKNSKPAVM